MYALVILCAATFANDVYDVTAIDSYDKDEIAAHAIVWAGAIETLAMWVERDGVLSEVLDVETGLPVEDEAYQGRHRAE